MIAAALPWALKVAGLAVSTRTGRVALAITAALIVGATLYASGRLDGGRDARARTDHDNAKAVSAGRSAWDAVDRCHDLGGDWDVSTGNCR